MGYAGHTTELLLSRNGNGGANQGEAHEDDDRASLLIIRLLVSFTSGLPWKRLRVVRPELHRCQWTDCAGKLEEHMLLEYRDQRSFMQAPGNLLIANRRRLQAVAAG